MKTFLGIDWGGTYIKAGIVDSAGTVIEKKVFVSAKISKKKVFISRVKSLLDGFGRFRIGAIGIGAPGIVDPARRFIYYLPNIEGWENYPLGDVLTDDLGLPVFMDNDANVFALAEARLGAAKDFKRGIFLTLGTGLGGAVIFDGRILKGQTSAAELGHVPVSLTGRRCSCGGKGCIETFTGSKYLLERYKNLKKSKRGVTQVKVIFTRALAGEREALLVWQEFAHALGRFLAGMVNIFNPQVVVFGGGVAGAFALFKPLVEKAIKQQAMWPQVQGIKLVKAAIKNAGIVGAALLAKESQ